MMFGIGILAFGSGGSVEGQEMIFGAVV